MTKRQRKPKHTIIQQINSPLDPIIGLFVGTSWPPRYVAAYARVNGNGKVVDFNIAHKWFFAGNSGFVFCPTRTLNRTLTYRQKRRQCCRLTDISILRQIGQKKPTTFDVNHSTLFNENAVVSSHPRCGRLFIFTLFVPARNHAVRLLQQEVAAN